MMDKGRQPGLNSCWRLQVDTDSKELKLLLKRKTKFTIVRLVHEHLNNQQFFQRIRNMTMISLVIISLTCSQAYI